MVAGRWKSFFTQTSKQSNKQTIPKFQNSTPKNISSFSFPLISNPPRIRNHVQNELTFVEKSWIFSDFVCF